MSEIIRGEGKACFAGCDFVVQLGEGRKNTEIRLLQLTDMQFIDASQRRTPDRIQIPEINAWASDKLDVQCANQIRSLVAQTCPDLIFITGDIVYGSFDDSGRVFKWFCDFMDGFEIPWAPVFGNHDNECMMGVSWQCEQFENSKYCMFKRGEVSGNSNYSVGVAAGDELLRVLHMTDSNGCLSGSDDSVIYQKQIFPDQLRMIEGKTEKIEEAQGKRIPAFMAFHFATEEFIKAEESKGYRTAERNTYTIGVDVPAKDGDFGCKLENITPAVVEEDFLSFVKANGIEAVFSAHHHAINTCIKYEGVRWIFGLKTGQYDYHNIGQLGGTLVCLYGKEFTVRHVPALTPLAHYPGCARMFQNFFAEDKFIIE